ncbi:hypothetical protein CMQ_4207 [Grosmannia clavigera kw1407]|uniref:Uncharacterized protein n=1 Tax=Grosmannia clavigera (strain kw1407 / UAMH 11150) TaxID=655863 RepID=F0X903_GROCL|nr:uncharacterized protein CMQ_4207 [Grosmannia clavigera kw1407]EFX06138.1 hypothetical protein CMQ_4207 [Grosmannia clavigera kw1407]
MDNPEFWDHQESSDVDLSTGQLRERSHTGLTLRTDFPSGLSISAIRLRPAFYTTHVFEFDIDATLDDHFPGVWARNGWLRPSLSIYGFRYKKFVASLFNMEGLLQLCTRFTSEEVTAGLILVLYDFLPLVWFPTFDAWTTRQIGKITETQDEDSSDKRFLIIPIYLEMHRHWMLAIVDRVQETVFWYNSREEFTDPDVPMKLTAWLASTGLTPSGTAYHHQIIPVSQQLYHWESGLYILDCVRSFFGNPSLNETIGPIDWAASHQYSYPVPVLGNLDNSTKKFTWMVTYWIAWIRLELGHADFSPLRIPCVPTLKMNDLDVIGRLNGDISLWPNAVGNATGYSDRDISMELDKILGPDPMDIRVADSTLICTQQEVAVNFAT